MKYLKLVPNAHFSKEWEGYIKSWTLKKKSKLHKKKVSSSSASFRTESFKNINDFSCQEIRVAAQKHTLKMVSCSTNDKF